MKTKKKELTSLEKIIVVFVIICIITYVMRVWDPEFLGWFHISSMKNNNFLTNIFQLVWFTVLGTMCFVWVVNMVLMLLELILFFVSISPGIITISIDILISVWNLISRIIPIMPYIDVNCTKRYMATLEKLEGILGILMPEMLIGCVGFPFILYIIS